MIFTDLPDGSDIFIDANTFVYHFTANSQFGKAYTDLLARVESGQAVGWISPHIMAEVAHRLMTIEACHIFGWSYAGIAAKLQKHPLHFQQLQTFSQAIQIISQLGLHFLTVNESHILTATHISRQYGLMTNDAIVVALMQDRGLNHLARNDSDFDRVPSIKRYSPS